MANLVLTPSQQDFMRRLFVGCEMTGCTITSREIEELSAAYFIRLNWRDQWVLTSNGTKAV